MKLTNNKQLYAYLVSLSVKLKDAGATPLSEAVASAARTAAAIPATEFLGEARIALVRVLKMDVSSLNESERAELVDVLGQVNSALDNR